MANQINPRWYEPRQCFRSRKTINGKVRTFYGGSGGSGSFDREANAQAVLQIKKQIDAAQREVDDVKADVHQRLVNLKDSMVLSDANEQAMVQSSQALSDGKPPPRIPLIAEMREHIEQLQEENALLVARLAAKDE